MLDSRPVQAAAPLDPLPMLRGPTARRDRATRRDEPGVVPLAAVQIASAARIFPWTRQQALN